MIKWELLLARLGCYGHMDIKEERLKANRSTSEEHGLVVMMIESIPVSTINQRALLLLLVFALVLMGLTRASEGGCWLGSRRVKGKERNAGGYSEDRLWMGLKGRVNEQYYT